MVRGSVRKDPGTPVIAELIYGWIKDPRISGVGEEGYENVSESF